MRTFAARQNDTAAARYEDDGDSLDPTQPADAKRMLSTRGGAKAAKAVSKRIRTRWANFAANAKPNGLPDDPEWTPYQETDRACLIIDREDRIKFDADANIRQAWGSDVLHFR